MGPKMWFASFGWERNRARLSSVVLSNRTRGKRHKLKHKRFHVNTTSTSVLSSWQSTGTPWEAVESPHWRSPKASWTWPWVACFGWLFLSRVIGSDDHQRSFPTSTILWFCISVIMWSPMYFHSFLLWNQLVYSASLTCAVHMRSAHISVTVTEKITYCLISCLGKKKLLSPTICNQSFP